MAQIDQKAARSKAQLIKANGGTFAAIICVISGLVALRAVVDFDTNTLGLAAMAFAAGAALYWYANRMAMDAIAARETGKILSAKVLAVQYIARDDGWATMFPKARLVWEDENYTKGQSTLHPYRYVSQWQPGDEITVYRGYQKTWWEGDVGQRVSSRALIPKVSAQPAV